MVCKIIMHGLFRPFNPKFTATTESNNLIMSSFSYIYNIFQLYLFIFYNPFHS